MAIYTQRVAQIGHLIQAQPEKVLGGGVGRHHKRTENTAEIAK